MRFIRVGMSVVLMLVAVACGEAGEPETKVAKASTSGVAATALPCDESEQTYVAWDVPGPGRPTPEKAVAPYAGALTLVAQKRPKATTVLGLRADGSLLRVYDVTKGDDGWWPDGYRECSS
ncbi:hypothetical protein ACFP3Q_13280 [Nocardioides sp. GCM10027113]|uniref:hypothetical protein n=1 Tax=unclassified Nocardioides TaxID=2615069 RepID=UPI00361A5F1D